MMLIQLIAKLLKHRHKRRRLHLRFLLDAIVKSLYAWHLCLHVGLGHWRAGSQKRSKRFLVAGVERSTGQVCLKLQGISHPDRV